VQADFVCIAAVSTAQAFFTLSGKDGDDAKPYQEKDVNGEPFSMSELKTVDRPLQFA
jgi:hypothetical protein